MGKERHTKSKKSESKSEFAWDKPKDCKKCYFWNKGISKCALGGPENCYYRTAPPKQPENSCSSCPYGKHRSCIGYCTVQILKEERAKGGKRNG